MPDLILNCPQCNRSLRVPEDMLGRLVKCPTCGMTFTVARGTTTPTVPVTVEPVPDNRPAPFDEGPGQVASTPSAGSNLRLLLWPPGICLLVIGLIGLIGDLTAIGRWIRDPQGQAQEAADQARAIFSKMDPNAEVPPAANLSRVIIPLLSFLVLLSLLVTIAGIQMLRLRTYSLTIVGSIIASINCIHPCCILAMPFGVWALVILVRSDVRQAFE